MPPASAYGTSPATSASNRDSSGSLAAPLSCSLHTQHGLGAASVDSATARSRSPHFQRGPGIPASLYIEILPSTNLTSQEPSMTACGKHSSFKSAARPNTRNTFSTSITQSSTPAVLVEALSPSLRKPGLSADETGRQQSKLTAFVGPTPLIKTLDILPSSSVKSPILAPLAKPLSSQSYANICCSPR